MVLAIFMYSVGKFTPNLSNMQELHCYINLNSQIYQLKKCMIALIFCMLSKTVYYHTILFFLSVLHQEIA